MEHVLIGRHGETKAQVKKYLQTQRIDLPLTPNGKLQARQLSERLRNENIQYILSSPALRALETLDVIMANLYDPKPSLALLADLLEFDGGDLEGCSYDEIRMKHSKVYDAWFGCSPEKRLRAKFPGGESFLKFLERGKNVIPVLNQISYIKGNCFILGHGTMNSMLTCLILNLNPEEIFPIFHFNNCGLVKIKLNGLCGTPQIIF